MLKRAYLLLLDSIAILMRKDLQTRSEQVEQTHYSYNECWINAINFTIAAFTHNTIYSK